MFSERKQKEAF